MQNIFKYGEEDVTREAWGWIALYKDGSYLKQFDNATGLFHKFGEIDVSELDVFVMQNLDEPTNLSKRYEIHFVEGMKPIHFYKRGKLNMGGENEKSYVLYCFGFEQNIDGRIAKTIMTIFPNGTVAIKNS